MKNRPARKRANACRDLLRRLQRENGSDPERNQALSDACKAFEELVRLPNLTKPELIRLVTRIANRLVLGCLNQQE